MKQTLEKRLELKPEVGDIYAEQEDASATQEPSEEHGRGQSSDELGGHTYKKRQRRGELLGKESRRVTGAQEAKAVKSSRALQPYVTVTGRCRRGQH